MNDAEFMRLQMAYFREYCQRQIWRNVRWNGAEFWQLPEDVLAMEAAIYQSKVDAVVEIGVNLGGGLEFYSTLLSSKPRGLVVGVDISPQIIQMATQRSINRTKLICGDSKDPATVKAAKDLVEDRRTLVILDSDHSEAHVAQELELYAPLVSPDSYLIVFDGSIKDLVGVWQIPPDAASNNPETAIKKFLPKHPEFQRDYSKNWYGITNAPGGFLRKKP